MIKNKVVLSVGLLAGVTAGVSFSENTLQGTDIIDKQHTQSVFLTDAINAAQSAYGKKYYHAFYYNLKCYINNLLYPAEMNISMQQTPNHFNSVSEFLLNNEKIVMGGNGIVSGTLKAGNNTLELKNLVFPNAKQPELKFSTSTPDYPGMGYKVAYCTYTYARIGS